jgi:hypothetical protein
VAAVRCALVPILLASAALAGCPRQAPEDPAVVEAVAAIPAGAIGAVGVAYDAPSALPAAPAPPAPSPLGGDDDAVPDPFAAPPGPSAAPSVVPMPGTIPPPTTTEPKHPPRRPLRRSSPSETTL